MRNKVRFAVVLVLVAFALPAAAQYNQLGKKNEFMAKVELGYGPFMGNNGDAGEYGYYLDKFYNAVNISGMAGLNISQDWFVGAGAGFNYFHSLTQGVADPMMGFNVFLDMDFRPIWKAVMGLDYQPITSFKVAPLVGVRAGGSILMGNPDQYGITFTPMGELYAGINWYYMHGLHNMERNWHSLYATIGVQLMQQTVFLPITVGWRW